MIRWILVLFVIIFITLECVKEEETNGEEPPPVDNTPPITNITYPHNGDHFHNGDVVDITAEVTDSAGVARVNFRIYNDTNSSVVAAWDDYAEPYVYIGWKPLSGYGATTYYTITVTGYDISNNSSQESISVSCSWGF